MALLHISMFGRLRCTTDGHEVNGLEARKVQELLVYLVLNRSHACTRDSLATLLWSERNESHARKYLRQALWQLQSALDRAYCHSHELMHVDNEWVEINAQAALWIDVAEFERIYETTHAVDDRLLTVSQVEKLCHAVGLYQGDLLQGWYQDWCVFERERFQQMYLIMLDKVIGHAEHVQNYAMGAHFCELSLRVDPARERTHRRLMRLHCLTGNRSAALRQYETCAEVLRRELDVEPAQSTTDLYERIRSDLLPAPLPRAGQSVDIAELQSVLANLAHLQSSLQQTMLQVQDSIERVEQLVRAHS